jgi:hypothetical protein
MSLSGTLYCYRNPLAFDPETGDRIRNDWYDTTCCPPNLERTFASLPGYFYSTSADGLYVHLYDNSELNWKLEDGTPIKVVQKTGYPWQGDVAIELSPASRNEFTMYVRIPGWCERPTVKVNGRQLPGATSGQYLGLRRKWSAGDTVHLDFDMTPQMLEANARIAEDNGRVAVQRGPLVYCLEQLDQPQGVELADVALVADGPRAGQGFSESFDKDLLDGVVVLHHEGATVQASDARRGLYFRSSAAPAKSSKTTLTFVPYYAWANRATTPMLVWTPLAQA